MVERFDPDEYIRQKDNEEKVGKILFWPALRIHFDLDPVDIVPDPVDIVPDPVDIAPDL